MPYDRKHFFDAVRKDLFYGNLTQSQVDGMNYLLEVWETHFEANNPNDGTMWLAYALATFYHETAYTMQPIEEYGKGAGKSYGKPVAPHNVAYYGRGHVQLTWDTNYQKGQQQLLTNYGVDAPLYPQPELMLDDQPSALVLYDGMSVGWFTGVGLPKYFNATVEDPVNARRIVNGTDQAQTIAGYYTKFKAAIATAPTPEPSPEPEPEPTPEPIYPTVTISSDIPVWIKLGDNVYLVE